MASTSRLATLAQLALGEIRAEPGLLELSGPTGRKVLELRVMQVMVTLMRHAGRPVARDTLIDECWGGRSATMR